MAVVGASRVRGKIGSEILHNLIASGFRGRVHPVHPTASTIEGLTCSRDVSEIPGPVDLAVMAVPADHVFPVVDACITKGVKGICVITAGFAETNDAGRELETRLVEKIRTAGCLQMLLRCFSTRRAALFQRLCAPT